jgi:hypothetical protein
MNTTAARKGRERTCNQCGAVYRSIRNTSRFCSTPCRKKAGRGSAPVGGPKAGPEAWGMIAKALHRAGYVGRVGPINRRDTSAPTYALLVDPETAHAELAHQFDRRGWGLVSREEFAAALKADGIQGFTTRSPEAAEQKRWKDRQRQRMARAA